MQKVKSRGYRDVMVKVAGKAVCVGDMRFAAEAIGVSYASFRRYSSDHPVAGLEILKLPDLWSVGGGKPLTTEQAAQELGCDVASVRANKVIERVRWPSWSMPHELIDSLRAQNKRQQMRKRRERATVSAG